MMEVSTHGHAPDAFRRLAWKTFFVDRGRGGTGLERHFPWIEYLSDHTWYVTLALDGRIVGGLVVRGLDFNPAGPTRLSAVGLVCVDPEFRGQGLSRRLIGRTVLEATARGIETLLLWTSKHSIYEPFGFQVCDPSLFGPAYKPFRGGPFEAGIRRRVWPSQDERALRERGLPPFACDAAEFSSADGGARLVALEDGTGPILAEWGGPPGTVADLAEQVLPTGVRINAMDGDPLLDEMSRRGWKLRLTAARLQMMLPLGPRSGFGAPIPIQVRVLDRI